MSSEEKICRKCSNKYIVSSDDFSFYEKMGVPAPILCPNCRFKRRAVFRNERNLYKRECGMCKRSVITMYSPQSPYIIYCNDCWFSDKWDAFDYGEEYDPKRPFFDQLKELTLKVPKSATYSSPHSGPNVNSEYANFAGGNKDCYLVFNAGPLNENCAYMRGFDKSRDIFDSYFGDESERIYEGVNVHKSAGLAWAQNCSGCVDSWFLRDSSGCQDCFGCVNLRNKSFHFLNEPLPKELWRKKVSEIVGSYKKTEEFKREFENFSLKFPRRENNNLKSVNVSGDYIFESKNCRNCFEASFAEDCAYSFSIKYSKDCYDLLGHGRKGELLLEGTGVGDSNRVLGCWWAENCHDVEYSFGIRSSAYCIGCDSIKNGEYCILNKRYSKEEYENLKAKIIDELKISDEYGLFFPSNLAFFAYNESIGQDNLTLSKEQAEGEGFRWQEEFQKTEGQGTLLPAEIPDHIKDVSEKILTDILTCVSCGRNYRLIQAELAMYRKAVIPIPRKCFSCRHQNRLELRGPLTLFDRNCANCQKSIKTNFAPARPEIVYCESCYQSEVI